MLKRSEVLKANKENIVLNWISFKVWYNQDIKTSINETIEHERIYCNGIELDISVKEVKIYLINYLKSLTSENKLNNMLNKLYDKYCKKMNFKNFMLASELPFKNKKEMCNYINQSLVMQLEN